MVFWIFFKVTCLLWVGRRKVKCMGLIWKRFDFLNPPKQHLIREQKVLCFIVLRIWKLAFDPHLPSPVLAGETLPEAERGRRSPVGGGEETLLRGSLWLSCYYWSAECWTFLNLAFMSRQNFFWKCMLFGNLQPTSNKNHEMADTENLCCARRLVPSSKWCLCEMDFSANAIIDMAKDIVFLLSIYKWN